MCEWFAGCDHAAAGHVEHPVLGRVPTCRRCAVKLDLPIDLDLAYTEQHESGEWRVYYMSATVGRHAAKYKALAQVEQLNG